MRCALVLVLMMALSVPAIAQTEKTTEIPNLVGNWTGPVAVVSYEKNTIMTYNGTTSFIPNGGEMTVTVTEQKGKLFAGKIVRAVNPKAVEVVLGILSSDNKSFSMVDEDGYWWGEMISPSEIEVSYQEVDMEGMLVVSGILKKV